MDREQGDLDLAPIRARAARGRVVPIDVQALLDEVELTRRERDECRSHLAEALSGGVQNLLDRIDAITLPCSRCGHPVRFPLQPSSGVCRSCGARQRLDENGRIQTLG